MKQVWKVGRVAAWQGWCTPCGREDRPLVLTRSGPSGLRAWLAGLGDEDRCLLLTCRACGAWQVVPLHEADDPEVVAVGEDHLAAPAEAPAGPAVVCTTAPRLLVLPDALPPVVPTASPELVAATRLLLAEARGGQQRTALTRPARPPRSTKRRGPTPRRPDRPIAQRVPRASQSHAGRR